MRRFLVSAVAAAALATGLGHPAPALAAAPDVICTAPLVAGQHTTVGRVVLARDASNVYVTYKTTDGWKISELHLHFAASLGAVPQNAGGPTPGQFAYKGTAADVTSFTFTIPRTWLPKDARIVLAHAVVGNAAGTAPCDATLVLPTGPVTLCYEWTWPPEGPGYYTAHISGAGLLDGTYPGWCVDLDDGFGGCIDVQMISSLDPAAAGWVDRPENLDALNYLLNQDWSVIGANRDEIQAAIWTLIDDLPWTVGGGIVDADQAIVDQIVSTSLAQGAGYVPGSGALVAVILAPIDTESQVTVIALANPECPPVLSAETAWAGDLAFPGANWALYFTCPKLTAK